MWYFAWILGTALAVCFGIINAMWHEFKENNQHHKPCSNSCSNH